MMIQLLENDIEIIEVADAWRQEASNNMPVVWLNDGHTGPTGRKIFAEALAERLQRYEFARKLKAKPSLYTYSEAEQTGTKMITLRFNKAWLTESGWAKRKKNTPFPYDDPQTLKANMPGKKGKNDKGYVYVKPPLKPSAITDLKNATFTTLTVKSQKLTTKDHGALDLVMVGDSQLHTPASALASPAIISAELNGMFRWGSKSWSGFDVPNIFWKSSHQVRLYHVLWS